MGLNGYFGGQKLTLDGKGRFTMPMRFRERLNTQCQGQLVLCKRPEHGVLVIPAPEFEPMVSGLVNVGLDALNWRTLMLGTMDEVQVDSAERVMLSPILRDWLGVSENARELELRGVGKCMELWESRLIAERDGQLKLSEAPESIRHVVL